MRTLRGDVDLSGHRQVGWKVVCVYVCVCVGVCVCVKDSEWLMVRGWQKGTGWRAHASPIYSWELGSGGVMPERRVRAVPFPTRARLSGEIRRRLTA